MAKKKKEDLTEEEPKKKESPEAITKYLIKQMNKGEDLPIAFNLKGSNPTDVKDFISTGSTVLDYCAANRRDGGAPCGKLTEIVGEEATGKSLIATQMLACTQRKGGIAVYLDTENAANPDFMKRCGLDVNKLVYMQPGSIEDCYAAIEKCILMSKLKDTSVPITIVWDSTAGTPAQAEVEGTYDANSRMGLAGKAHALGLRKITKMVGFDKVTLVFVNQLKYKIGVMFGDPMFAPGGKAVPFHSSLRIRLTRSKELTTGTGKLKETYGVHTIAKVIKSRLGPPMRRCEFDILFSSGVDDVNSIRDYLWEVKGVIKKQGGWMIMDYLGEEKKFRALDWTKMMKDKDFSTYVHDLLEEVMIIRYDDEDIAEQEVDPDSYLEMEAVAND